MKIITAALIAAVLAGSGAARAQEPEVDPARRIREKLGTMRINLDFTRARLSEVVAYFQEFSGLNFHIDPAVTTKDDDESRVTIRLKDVTLMTALKLILKPRDLTCVDRAGVLVICTKAQLGSQTVTRVYDVRDMTFQIVDFPGPKFELDARKPGIDPESWLVDEPKTTFSEENLIDLIKANTGERSWDDGLTSITQVNGLLVVSQSRSVQEEVRKLLDLLRQYK